MMMTIKTLMMIMALTHVLLYDYWCCQLRILSAYNVSVMFLLRYFYSIDMLSYQSLIILANQVSGLFEEKYLKKEYTYTILIFHPCK